MTARPLPFVLLGAGGHAKVLLALTTALRLDVRGVCDPKLAQQNAAQWKGLPVLGDDDALHALNPAEYALILGVGQVVRQDGRRRLYEICRRRGFTFPPLVHPAAWVACDARLSQGVQIMAGAVVQTDCHIGENTIVNTRSSLDHDCEVGSHVHVAPGATLCGNVQVGDDAFIAAGATILQGVRVGDGAIVGAGSTLRRNLTAGACAVGSDTRVLDRGSSCR